MHVTKLMKQTGFINLHINDEAFSLDHYLPAGLRI